MYKIVLVGDTSVGKSSIMKRFADDAFEESYLATIGVDFKFKWFSLNISGHWILMASRPSWKYGTPQDNNDLGPSPVPTIKEPRASSSPTM